MAAKDYVKLQREYFLSGETKTYDFRIKQLKKLKASIKKYEEEILDALYKDLGKSKFEAYTAEIGCVYEEINHNIKHLKKWMKPKRVKTPIIQFGSKSYVYSEPRGVVMIIAPWNYPFMLTLSPLVGAVTAGNTSLIKTSKNSANVSKVIEKMLEDTFDPKYIRVLKGGNTEVMEVLDESIDYVFFTGSPRIGRLIMEKSAKNLIPVTLELGGKSPAIIDKSANVKIAARRVAWGKFMNSGQTCIAPDHVYIHRDIKAEFIKEVIAIIKEFFGEDSFSSDSYGRIVDTRQFDRLISYLDEKKIVHGGKYDREKLKIEPTIMDNITYEDGVMKDEIFGPILPILEYENIAQVINEINSKPRPLALYAFSENNKISDKLVHSISYGGGCVNDTISHITNPNLPFGGNGNSGMGSYHGKESFDTFSHKKSVLKKSTKINIKIPFPPYEGKMKLARKLMK